MWNTTKTDLVNMLQVAYFNRQTLRAGLACSETQECIFQDVKNTRFYTHFIKSSEPVKNSPFFLHHDKTNCQLLVNKLFNCSRKTPTYFCSDLKSCRSKCNPVSIDAFCAWTSLAVIFFSTYQIIKEEKNINVSFNWQSHISITTDRHYFYSESLKKQILKWKASFSQNKDWFALRSFQVYRLVSSFLWTQPTPQLNQSID